MAGNSQQAAKKDKRAHMRYKESVTLGAIRTRKFEVTRSVSFIPFLTPTRK